MDSQPLYQPVVTSRAYQDIVAQIEHTITEGHLQVGNRLPGERKLAGQFGVSRVVIREAMRNLEARGIVEVRHGSGIYIRSMPKPALSQSLTLLLHLEEASLLDLYVVRQALELVSAPRAAQYATEEEIASLRTCLAEMGGLIREGIRSEEDMRALNAKDEEFHVLIAQGAHNMPLGTLLVAIIPLTFSGRLEIIRRSGGFERFIERYGRDMVQVEHTSIADAIANRDPKAAEHFLYSHLQRSMATYRDLQ